MDKSDFEKMLEAACSARNEKVDLNEYVNSVSEMISIGIRSVIEQNHRNIMAVDEGHRNQIKENVRKALEEALENIVDYTKEVDL